MGRFLSALLFCVGFCAPVSTTVFAYTRTVTSSGTPVHWVGTPRLPLAGNSTNSSGIGASDFFGAVVRGLQRWQAASGGAVSFDYWQGTDRGTYEPNGEMNGLSSIYFSSNSGSPMPAEVLGLTQVWYNTSSGEIVEADIELNDSAYELTLNPADTSGSGNGGSLDRRRVFIENVITHELGHAYGLSHSGGLQSAMLAVEAPEQAHLGCDEQSAIQVITRGETGGGRGLLSGQVVSEHTGRPVFGAHVAAISARKGTVAATGLTDPAGHYRIGGLLPGEYFVLAEPFFAGPRSLPPFYQGMDAQVCGGGRLFARTFLGVDGSGRTKAVTVPSGGTGSAPTLVAQCAEGSGTLAAISALPGTGALATAPDLHPVPGQVAGLVDRLDSGQTFYRLGRISGNLEIHVLGYSLFSPVETRVQLLDSSGREVTYDALDPVYRSADSGYVNHDSALLARGLPAGDYTLSVQQGRLGAESYPSGFMSLDQVPFVLITAAVEQSSTSNLEQVSQAARCRTSEAFATYSSPPGPPERHSVQDGGGIGFCGNVRIVRGDSGPPTDGGASPGAILGYFLPFLAAVACLKFGRMRLLRT